MAAMAGKRITQKTFDECVRENMEDFEMEKEAALADAIQQFETQGVDLTNVDLSGEDREAQQRATSDALEALKAAVTAKGGSPDEAVCRQSLLDLAAACANAAPNPSELAEAELLEGSVKMEKGVTVNQTAIAMAQGPQCLAALMTHEPLAEAALDCAAVVCRHHVEARDAFPPQGLTIVARILAMQAERAGVQLEVEGHAPPSAADRAAAITGAADAKASAAAGKRAAAVGKAALAAAEAEAPAVGDDAVAAAKAPAAEAAAHTAPVEPVDAASGGAAALPGDPATIARKCCDVVHILCLRVSGQFSVPDAQAYATHALAHLTDKFISASASASNI